MNDQLWDVFISHASEDKESVARPLAVALKAGGARVWIDEHELKLGDSLSGMIDRGLAASRFGIVILSKQFFAKRWPRAELAGLRALEEDGKKVILPVWHEVDKAIVAKHSPVLADLLSVSTSVGTDVVARSILEAIFDPDSASPSLKNPTVSRRLIELLSTQPDKTAFISFLKSHPKIVAHLLRSGTDPLWEVRIANVDFDAVALANVGTTRVETLHCVSYLPVWADPFDAVHSSSKLKKIKPKQPLRKAIKDAKSVLSKYHRPDAENTLEVLHHGALSKFSEVVKKLRDLNGGFSFFAGQYNPLIEITIFGGRRNYVDANEENASAWRNWRGENGLIRLRTYDGLIEAVQQSERFSGLDFRSYSQPSDPL